MCAISKLRDCYEIVTRLLQDCKKSSHVLCPNLRKIVARLLQDCYETDARLLRDCCEFVARLLKKFTCAMYILKAISQAAHTT